MNYALLFIPTFLKSFAMSVFLIIIFIAVSKKFDFFNRSRAKKGEISRLGGAAIILAFLAAIFTENSFVISQQFWGVIASSVLILGFGLWDDLKDMNWKIQLFFQICAAILIFIFGVQIYYVTNPFGGIMDFRGSFLPGLAIGILWLVLFMNSMNWLDGVDGLSGGISFIGSITIFFLSLKPEVYQLPMGTISMALAGAILGFLIFNFHPAKITAGTAGSVFMGFMLAMMAIFAGAKIATALLIMAIPIIDTFYVIWMRIKKGESIFRPDKNHLHYKLEDLGWSEKRIVLFFYAVTFLIAIVSLNTRSIGKLITILSVIAIMLVSFFILNRRISKAAKLKLAKQ